MFYVKELMVRGEITFFCEICQTRYPVQLRTIFVVKEANHVAIF